VGSAAAGVVKGSVAVDGVAVVEGGGFVKSADRDEEALNWRRRDCGVDRERVARRRQRRHIMMKMCELCGLNCLRYRVELAGLGS
jgi:hypothetical protein